MKPTLLKSLNVALLLLSVFSIALCICPKATEHLMASVLPGGVVHFLIGHAGGPQMAFSPLVTQFSSDLSTNLFPDNAFYKRSKDDKEFITANGAEVSLPQAGSLPGVKKNRTQLPATVNQRTDTAIKYVLDEFTTDPILVQNTEELVVNYKKRENILEDHKDKLITEVADNFLYRWAPDSAAAVLRTTGVTNGSAAQTRVAGAPGATGTRKRTSEEDVINVFNFFNKQNVPLEGRCALMTPDMYADLLGIDNFKLLQLIGSANQLTGKINNLYGFDIYLRTGGLVYDASGTLKAVGAATATTDNLASLFWHERFVRRAEGEVKVLSNTGDNGEGDPTYFGGIYSAIVRAGGSKSREDGAGVAVLVQGN